MAITRKARIRALLKDVSEGLRVHPARVEKLVRVMVEAEKIAIADGIDAHTKLIAAIDAALDDGETTC
jgi:hypothetical protein